MINRKHTTFVNKKEKKKDSFPFIPLFCLKKKKRETTSLLFPLFLNFIFLGDNKLPFNLRYTYL